MSEVLQRNWLKELDLGPSDRGFIITGIIETEYSIRNYSGVLKTGLGNPAAFRIFLRETLRNLTSKDARRR